MPVAGIPRQSALGIYRTLLRAYGNAGWWPGRSAFEVCVGAILTQNTAWTNAAKALANLRSKGLLSHGALRSLGPNRLAALIRASGTHNVKARRLAAFLRFVDTEYGGRVGRMRGEEAQVLRRKLLAVQGIGPETADVIALYAAGQPSFVVDAYARRIFGRLGWLRGSETYDEVQALFMSALPTDAALFNDYHAQIVRLAKEHCRARPICGGCPLRRRCARRGVERSGATMKKVKGASRFRRER